MNECIFFLTSETNIHSQYLCKCPKCLGYWSCLLSISYNIEKNSEKILNCHLETIAGPKLEALPSLWNRHW